MESDPRVKKGIELVEMIWWSLAKQIVKIAGEHYNWDNEKWQEATELFLKPSDYKVVPT